MNLKKFTECNKTVCLYENEDDTSKFNCGFLSAIEDNELLIENVTSSGEYDGYIAFLADKIYKVQQDSEYNRKIEKLYQIKKQHHQHIVCNQSIFKSVLKFAQTNGFAVTLRFYDSNYDDLQGFVVALDEDILTVEEVDTYGRPDGISDIDINSITKIYCDTADEHNYKLLKEM